jgi:RNA polymerase sigma-B factor
VSPLFALAPPRDRPLARDAIRELRLFRRYARFGDLAAREELFRSFLPLVRSLASRYRQPGEPLDDLLQVAGLGLLKAIDRFDPERGVKFTSYAVPSIAGELKRHFRDRGWSVQVQRSDQERVLAVTACGDRLSSQLGRSPSPREIAAESELSLEEVLDALEVATSARPRSLDAPLRDDDGDYESLGAAVGVEEGGFDLVECRAVASRVLTRLPERERRVLYLRFAEDLTQSEIAERIGVSQMHVSRILRRALERARTLAEGAP